VSAGDDDESTEFKLTLLSSVHPSIDQSILLDLLLDHDGNVERASESLSLGESSPRKIPRRLGQQSSLTRYVEESASTVKKKRVLSKRGKTLHLYSPEDVAAHTPCSIIHNFLPPGEANALLKELLVDAQTYESMTFKLFDNVVQSPHTACLYVNSFEEMQNQKTECVCGKPTLNMQSNADFN
jgi:hypothetical protein